jgi:transcriptional regulator with XRE-family HTH domain
VTAEDADRIRRALSGWSALAGVTELSVAGTTSTINYPYHNLSYTLPRLMGMHNLSGTAAAKLLGMSAQHMWMLLNGRRRPTYERLRAIGDLFGIHHDRLVDTPFEDLLPELADPQRFRNTEHRITELEQQLSQAKHQQQAKDDE